MVVFLIAGRETVTLLVTETSTTSLVWRRRISISSRVQERLMMIQVRS